MYWPYSALSTSPQGFQRHGSGSQTGRCEGYAGLFAANFWNRWNE